MRKLGYISSFVASLFIASAFTFTGCGGGGGDVSAPKKNPPKPQEMAQEGGNSGASQGKAAKGVDE